MLLAQDRLKQPLVFNSITLQIYIISVHVCFDENNAGDDENNPRLENKLNAAVSQKL